MNGSEARHSDGPYFLAVDVGNTRTKSAAFRGTELIGQWSWPTPGHASASIPDAFQEGWGRHVPGVAAPQAVVVASVVEDVAARLLGASTTMWAAAGIEVTGHTDLGLEVDVPRPAAVGVDRLLAASEAYRLLGGPVLVAALGTVAALSAVTRDGRFVGGALYPGLETATWSVHARTSRLPDVSPAAPTRALGTDTETAIRAGIMFGAAGALDRLAAELAEEMDGEARLVLTGGEAALLSPLMKTKHTVEPDLVLRGLASAFLGTVPGR